MVVITKIELLSTGIRGEDASDFCPYKEFSFKRVYFKHAKEVCSVLIFWNEYVNMGCGE